MAIRPAGFGPDFVLAVEGELADEFTVGEIGATVAIKDDAFGELRDGEETENFWLNVSRLALDGI